MTHVDTAVDGPKNSVTIAVLPRRVTAVVVDVAILLLLPCFHATVSARWTARRDDSTRYSNAQMDRRREGKYDFGD
jgi:hypothetical protein